MSDQKYYQLGTYTEDQWDELHVELTADHSDCDHVPSRCVECADDQLHSLTRGTYLLTDEEAKNLKQDPRVKFINIDYKRYEQYTPPKNELQASRPELIARYSAAVKNYREFENSGTLAASPDATDANRTGYQLYRCQQKLDPWVDGSLADNDIPEVNIFQYGTGRHVDVIVADEGMWIGHPEFQNNTVLLADRVTPIEKPNGYTGGNVLPGNGTCDVLDLVLDSPYYIDPDWFDADPINRLTTRWDGTIVPVEAVARAWWSNSNLRSVKFASAGTVTVSASYTRLNTSGDNTRQPVTIPGFVSEGEHGTPCGALTYGRTHGWAYNANKWTLDLYGFYGSGIEQGFDIQKIFHQLKPINPLFGTKDPTISSNSWGYRAYKDPQGSTWYYTHRSSSNNAYTTTSPDFLIGSGFNSSVDSIVLQPDGKILVGGYFSSYDGVTQKGITRLNSDGSRDTDFDTGTGTLQDDVRTIVLQPDGKILLGGGFNSFNGVAQGYITRLNSDGSRDTDFDTGTGFANTPSAARVFTMAVQSDGKILVGGDFTSFNGTTQNRITRLNADGSIDTSFVIGTGFNGSVSSIALQSDGKIIVGGNFTAYNGTTQNNITRLNADGSRDTSFVIGNGFNIFVRIVAVQSDGKILAGGDFTLYDGNTIGRIARLESDGNIDNTFYTNTGTGSNGSILSFTLQSDGKIIVGGNFSSFNGVAQNDITRLNSDGSRDTSFVTGTGFNNPVLDTVLQSDGKILVGGVFTSYDGVTQNRITRLGSNGSGNSGIPWLSTMGTQGDTFIFGQPRWKSEMKDNSLTTALDELIDSGVLFVVASGNSNQKQVNYGHPDFDNYITQTNGGSLEDSSFFEFGIEVTGTTNRRGFPQQGGKYVKEDGTVDYKTINIGALDDDYKTSLEAKVGYSDRGEGIDLYTPADGTLAANKTYTNEGFRPDTYPGFVYNGGIAYDCAFGGTSAACPVAAGFLATVMEHNRDWTWRELKDWILTLDIQDPSDFYYGVESTTPTTTNWTDYESLEGGVPIVAYQGYFDSRFKSGTRKVSSGLSIKGLKFRK